MRVQQNVTPLLEAPVMVTEDPPAKRDKFVTGEEGSLLR